MIRRSFLVPFLLVTLGLLSSNDGAAEPIARKILALYTLSTYSSDQQDIYYTPLHRFAEMPLNHLGMEFEYHDIKAPLPAPESLDGYRGVITWFRAANAVSDPLDYCRWLERVLDRKLKVVILGDPGIFGSEDLDARTPPACAKAFAKLGVRIGPIVGPSPLFSEILHKESEMVEFERVLSIKEFPSYRVLRPLKGARSYLTIGSPIYPEAKSDPVVVTAQGGVALAPFVIYHNQKLVQQRRERNLFKKKFYDNRPLKADQIRWRVDPFAFFESAFGLKGLPRPDITTINGRRVYYSHIDGDGFFNVSEIDRRSFSGKIFLDEILKRYSKSPFTVSLITGYYDLQRYGRRDALKLSREVMSLPNVEGASHGYAHPLFWQQGKVALNVPGYRYSAEKEILASLATINEKFTPLGRPARIFLWTGDCLPDEETILLAEKNGYLNMNGGDTKFDIRYKSVAYVSPLSRKLGKARQIYTSNANENIYTNEWEGPYYGFREVVESFENTETPRRLKSVNIYMHFYSAEKHAALKVLKDAYDWVHQRPLFPAFASVHIKASRSFFDLNIIQEGPQRFRFTGGEHLYTIRFDDESRVPDLKKSKNVIGYNRHGGSLYVHLAPARERLIVLTYAQVRRPYLEAANVFISGWKTAQDSVHFLQRGWWDAEIVIAGMNPRTSYRVSAGDEHRTVRSDAEGRLEIRLDTPVPGGPFSPVSVVGDS